MQVVEAGVVSKLLDLAKTISRGLFNAIDKLLDNGVVVDKQEQTEDGGLRMVLKVEGKKAEMTVTPIPDRKGYCNVVVKIPGKSPIKLNNLPEKEIESEVLSTLKEYFNLEAGFESVKSSKRIKATLQKIETASGFNITLKRITANYSPIAALAAIDQCITNDEFCNQIPETDTVYMISEDKDDYIIDDVTTSAETWSINPYTELVLELQRVLMLFSMSRVKFQKAEFSNILCEIQGLEYGLTEARDLLMKQSFEEFNEIPNLFDVHCDLDCTCELPDNPNVAVCWCQQVYTACETYAAGFTDLVFQSQFLNCLGRLHDTLTFLDSSQSVEPTAILPLSPC